MKRLKRGCWIAAWSAWAWCGLGLAHNLPKRADVVCSLNLQDGEKPECFANGGAEFVSILVPKREGPSTVRVRVSNTGTVKREFVGPTTQDNWINYNVSVASAYLVTTNKYVSNPPAGAKTDDLAILDLHHGDWTSMPVKFNSIAVFHRRQPWCICSSGDPTNEITVADLNAKRILFRWEGKSRLGGDVQAGSPFFVSDDRIGIPIKRVKRTHGSAWDALEIWSIREPAKPPQLHENVEVPFGASASADGTRIAWAAFRQGPEMSVEVFDTQLGRMLLTKDRQEGDYVRRTGARRPLSRDGRSVLIIETDPWLTMLVDVDSGKVVWKGGPNERGFVADPETDRFLVFEDWRFGLTENPDYFWNWAVRSLKDGSLLYRCWSPPFSPLRIVSDNGEYFLVRKNGRTEIHRMPYRIDWPLLVLCQTILALPLMLTWLLLFWRRRRRRQLSL